MTWGITGFSIVSLCCFPSSARGEARDPKPEAPDAEMLKDLELFRQANLAQERELLRILHLLNKIPLFEQLRMESPPPRNPKKR
jgi:hypothetical protein